jgi:hypothetical protein
LTLDGAASVHSDNSARAVVGEAGSAAGRSGAAGARPIFGFMIAVVLFAGLCFVFLALVMARWATHPRLVYARMHPTADAALRRIAPEQLRALVVELLGAMGIAPAPVLTGDERRLLAVRADPFRAARYVVFLEAAPEADVVAQPLLLELAEEVRYEGATLGLLFTPYAIDRSGLAGFDAPVELVDGARLRALVAVYLPSRVAEVDRYRGFGHDGEREIAPRLTPRPT